MKNPKLYREISQNLELQSPQEVLRFRYRRNRLFFASSANIIYTDHLSSFQNGRSKGFLLPSEMNQIELEDGDLITAFDFLMEKESLIIGTQNGLLLLHNVDDNSDWDLLYEIAVEEKENYGDGLDVCAIIAGHVVPRSKWRCLLISFVATTPSN